jgi:hypothetical protein
MVDRAEYDWKCCDHRCCFEKKNTVFELTKKRKAVSGKKAQIRKMFVTRVKNGFLGRESIDRGHDWGMFF